MKTRSLVKPMSAAELLEKGGVPNMLEGRRLTVYENGRPVFVVGGKTHETQRKNEEKC